MPEILLDLPEEAIEKLRFAARLMGVSESGVVIRLIDSWSGESAPAESPRNVRSPKQNGSTEPREVPVFALYAGERVDGRYDPGAGTLTIDTPPWSGELFPAPSGAAKAVIRHFKPGAGTASRNGYEFWKLSATREKLSSLRTG